ncbi:MAG: radical SAM protein, partial [Lachnospiraceae bacterium]|nr:radical SAM protein [Lachnospiraceae bacterium]
NQLIFGASVTATTANLREITGREFLDELQERGCKAVIYVEFVPVTEESKDLAPGDAEREYLKERLYAIREEYPDMVFVSFPGDEKSSGGCLAAGRGFFHINSHGGEEPCPFSPYSDINVKNSSLRQALHSPLFTSLRKQGVLMEEHSGGCVLFERKDSVEVLLAERAVCGCTM